MKLLVVSAWAPPMGGGSPIALAQRLGALPRGSYSIVTSERRASRREAEPSGSPPSTTSSERRPRSPRAHSTVRCTVVDGLSTAAEK